jgi:hypothetical protein
MDESAKETIIIVHGTFAGLKPGTTQWYQPVDGDFEAEGFIGKLNAALRERGSSARCWAHCTEGNQIFHCSGENNWVARTSAASALGDYVVNLQKQGWLCHIVAHSHGGNVVVEALPKIMATPTLADRRGKITTLGTPFIDTKSPISETRKQRDALNNTLTL